MLSTSINWLGCVPRQKKLIFFKSHTSQIRVFEDFDPFKGYLRKLKRWNSLIGNSWNSILIGILIHDWAARYLFRKIFPLSQWWQFQEAHPQKCFFFPQENVDIMFCGICSLLTSRVHFIVRASLLKKSWDTDISKTPIHSFCLVQNMQKPSCDISSVRKSACTRCDAYICMMPSA